MVSENQESCCRIGLACNGSEVESLVFHRHFVLDLGLGQISGAPETASADSPAERLLSGTSGGYEGIFLHSIYTIYFTLAWRLAEIENS